MTSLWQQIRLVLWKNFLIRRKQPLALLLELAWPLILALILLYIRQRTPLLPTGTAKVFPFAMPSAGHFPFVEHVLCQRAFVKHNGPQLDSNGFGRFSFTASHSLRTIIQSLAADQSIDWTSLSNFPKDLGNLAEVFSHPGFYSGLQNQSDGLSDASSKDFQSFLISANVTNGSVADLSSAHVNWNKLLLLTTNDEYTIRNTPVAPLCNQLGTRVSQLSCLVSLQPSSPGKYPLLSGTPVLFHGVKFDPVSVNATLCTPFLFNKVFEFERKESQHNAQLVLCSLPSPVQIAVLNRLVDTSTSDFVLPSFIAAGNPKLARLPAEIENLSKLLKRVRMTDTDPILRFVDYLLRNRNVSPLSAATVAFCSKLEKKVTFMDILVLILKRLREQRGKEMPPAPTTPAPTTSTASAHLDGKIEQPKAKVAKNVTKTTTPTQSVKESQRASIIVRLLRQIESGAVYILFSPNNVLAGTIINKALQPFNELLKGIGTSAKVFAEQTTTLADSLELLETASRSPAASAFLASPLCTTLLPVAHPYVKFTCRFLSALQPGFEGSDHELVVDEIVTAIKASSLVAKGIHHKFSSVNLTERVQGVRNETALTDTAMLLSQQQKLMYAGIVFKNLPNNGTQLPRHIIYKIRQNSTLVPSTNRLRKFAWSPGLCVSRQNCIQYQLFGFNFLQDILDRAIMKLQANLTEAESAAQLPGAWLQSFPYPCYLDDSFTQSIARTLPLVLILGWVLSVASLIKNLVYEKEHRLKEFMKVMGLRPSAHWIAWFITSFVLMSVSSLLLTVVLKAGSVLEHIDFLAFFLFLELFSIALIGFCFLISTFFSNANLAACCGSLLFFACYLPYAAVSLQEEDADSLQRGFACLLAPSAFGLSTSYIAYYEQQGVGLNWRNMRDSPLYNDSFSFVVCCTFLALDAIMCIAVACYLDLVFPGKYGVGVKWNAPFQRSFWISSRGSDKTDKHLRRVSHVTSACTLNQPLVDPNGSPTDPFAAGESRSPSPMASAVFGSVPANVDADLESEAEPTHLKCGVAIHQLVKEYTSKESTNRAVDELSLNFYEGQITSFLGHNGAGKTTTMNVLSGIYEPTSGSAFVYGQDIRNEMSAIRHSLGICPQYNILFDKLTVEEHFRFYASMKGVSAKTIDQEIRGWLQEVGLVNKRNVSASDLSGGMQRRLSIGIAFVGGSRTVILDEPTAGVDPYSRRCIWDVLVKYRNQGRTIILSTHFMDEADILGDRIAIVAHGRLKCVGSSMFLKSCFGTGYTLTLVKAKSVSGLAETPDFSAESGANSETTSQVSSVPTLPHIQEETQPSQVLDVTQEQRSGDNEDLNADSAVPMNGEDEGRVVPTAFYRETVFEAIRAQLPGTRFLEDIGDEVSYRLPLKAEQSENFLELLSHLDGHMSDLAIASYAVSDSTLEQVFIQVLAGSGKHSGRVNATDSGHASQAMNLARSISERSLSKDLDLHLLPNHRDSIELTDMSRNEQPKPTEPAVCPTNLKGGGRGSRKERGLVLMAQQYRALFTKRYHHFKRNKKALASQVLLPVLLITLAMVVKRTQQPPANENPLLLVPNAYVGAKFVPIEVVNESFPFAKSQLETLSASCGGLGPRNLWERSADVSGDDSDATVRPTSDAPSQCHSDPGNRWSLHRVRPNPVSRVPEQCAGEVRFLQKVVPKRLAQHKAPAGVRLQNISTAINLYTFLLATTQAYSINRWGALTTGVRYSPAPLNTTGHAVVDHLAIGRAMKAWNNNNGYHSAPIYLNSLNNALLRAMMMSQGPAPPADYGISTITHPFNKTASQLQEDYLKSGIDLLIAIAVIFAMAFVPTSFCVYLIAENEGGAKGLQRLCGVSGIRYWTANFAWDMGCYTIALALIIVTILVFQEDVYTSEHTFTAVCVLFALYGMSSATTIYPFSFYFKNPSNAYVFLLSANMFIGVFGTLTTFLLEIFTDKDIERVNGVLRVFFLLFPNYCLGRGLMDLSFEYYKRLLATTYRLDTVPFSSVYGFGQEQIGRNVVAMFCVGVASALFTLALEYRIFQRLGARLGLSLIGVAYLRAGQSTVTDSDVLLEAERVKTGRYRKRSVVLDGLTKVYWRPLKSHRAVNALSLGVQRGECFGLLGINGAGKTTTFKMLTGEIEVTGGDAYLNGVSIVRNSLSAHKQVGYCPQFDALDNLLTCREHLMLYARLRGVPEAECESVAGWCIRRLELKNYADSLAGSLSAGNKRKLSAAVAIIGKPKLIFLDEPTTGMDPQARRFLWSVISGLVRLGHCVILTSHSMEECEALCNRLSIMVNGEFRCIGSPQHLKDKFGTGYTVTLRLQGQNPDVSHVKAFCEEEFPGCTMQDEHHNMIQYQLSNQLSLSKVFCSLLRQRVALGIEDYSVTQTTLDQVFVSFARNQTAGPQSDFDDPTYSAPSADQDVMESSFNENEGRDANSPFLHDESGLSASFLMPLEV